MKLFIIVLICLFCYSGNAQTKLPVKYHISKIDLYRDGGSLLIFGCAWYDYYERYDNAKFKYPEYPLVHIHSPIGEYANEWLWADRVLPSPINKRDKLLIMEGLEEWVETIKDSSDHAFYSDYIKIIKRKRM